MKTREHWDDWLLATSIIEFLLGIVLASMYLKYGLPTKLVGSVIALVISFISFIQARPKKKEVKNERQH